MARFSVEGDEDGNEKGPSNNRRLPKKPRTSSDPIVNTPKGASAFTSNTGNHAAASFSAKASSAPQISSARESISWKRARESEEEAAAADDDEEEEEEEEEEYEEDEEVVEEEEDEEERGWDAPAPLSVTLTDPEVLDCAICFEPLNPPVYQCENGHIACASCCINMKNKCASCSWPIGYNRCRAIEKVLESARISCPNTQHGCKASLNYSKKLDHQKTCIYAPCSCPHPDCTYIGLPYSVYTHFGRQHLNSSKQFTYNFALSISLDNNQKHVILRENVAHTLFVLNRFIEARGSLVNVVFIAPISSKEKFFYEVSATDGVSSIKLKTVAEMSPQWTGQVPDKKYVLVPNDFVTSGGQLKLELTIRMEHHH